MVTRAATSGKGKFVPTSKTFVLCGKRMAASEINDASEHFLYAVQGIVDRLNLRFSTAFRGGQDWPYFFNVIARNSTVRFHASAESAAR
jgi:hypothetical protein